MNRDELRQILAGYRWIRVRRFEDDASLDWEERYRRLERHHDKETTFLIETCRALARQLLSLEEQRYPSTTVRNAAGSNHS